MSDSAFFSPPPLLPSSSVLPLLCVLGVVILLRSLFDLSLDFIPFQKSASFFISAACFFQIKMRKICLIKFWSEWPHSADSSGRKWWSFLSQTLWLECHFYFFFFVCPPLHWLRRWSCRLFTTHLYFWSSDPPVKSLLHCTSEGGLEETPVFLPHLTGLYDVVMDYS